MKPKKHKKRMPGREPLTPSPSQAPETKDLSYDSFSAQFRSLMTPPQVSDPDNSPYRYEFQLKYNDGPNGPEIVSQDHISLTPEQIPGFSTMIKNLKPYFSDDAPLAWFDEIIPPGPGQPPGTKAASSATRFEDMLNARDRLVAARKQVTQPALLIEMGYPASPPRTLRRWLKDMGVSWADFKQWPR